MDGWTQVRIGAAVLLAIYCVVVAAFTPRELRFLASIGRRERRLFLTQDVLMQLAIVAALLPCILFAEPSRLAFTYIISGFTALWIVVTWTLITRYMYTYRLMLGRSGSAEQLRELLEQAERERAAGAASTDPEAHDA